MSALRVDRSVVITLLVCWIVFACAAAGGYLSLPVWLLARISSGRG